MADGNDSQAGQSANTKQPNSSTAPAQPARDVPASQVQPDQPKPITEKELGALTVDVRVLQLLVRALIAISTHDKSFLTSAIMDEIRKVDGTTEEKELAVAFINATLFK